MTTTRHQTDDSIRRWRSVWLGPPGLTWPWAASYLAWGLWFLFMALILFVEWVTPLPLHPVPLWEAVIAVFAATWVSGLADHDKSLKMLPRTLAQHLCSPRRPTTRTRIDRPMAERVRIKDDHS